MRQFIAEFRDPHYNPQTKNTGRLATVTETADGVRVKVEAEAAVYGFVTLSDGVISTDLWAMIRDQFTGGEGFVLRKGEVF